MEHKTLLRTPLYEAHRALKARLVPFAGYEMPVQYQGVLDETLATRASAGLFDVSHMGQVRVLGKGALEALDALVPNDLTKIKPGQAQYNFLCNEKGGVIDDIIVYLVSPEELFICVNAANRTTDVAWLKNHLPQTLAVEDESEGWALLALQGPKAQSVLSQIAQASALERMEYYWGAPLEVAGIPCFVSRTGYTGEDGFEIYAPTGHSVGIWQRLLEFKEVFPIGLGARDTLRLEMGYPLHGHELSESIDPLSAGLGWAVRVEKGKDFLGKAALKHLKENGTPKKLVAFTVDDRRTPRAGYEIVDASGRTVGTITSGSFSPHRKAPIALGFVESLSAGPWKVKVRDETVALHGEKLPFVPSRVKKKAKLKN